MKKLLLFFYALTLSFLPALADDVTLQSDDKGSSGKSNRIEIPLPRVQADDSTVGIICDSLVTLAEVTITDLSGTVMYRSTEVLSPTGTLLFVTDTPEQQKFYIEIETDDKIFYGFIW